MEAGDIYWSLLEPYSYYPSIVLYMDANESGDPMVIFIEENPRRAVVKKENMIPYKHVSLSKIAPPAPQLQLQYLPEGLRASIHEANHLLRQFKPIRSVRLMQMAKERKFTYGYSYCLCTPYKRKNKSGMALCPRCNNWYHYTCQGLKQAPDDLNQWKCSVCAIFGRTDEEMKANILEYNETVF